MHTYHRLIIASSKGGVGKSTTALGLAVAFARKGKKVLLADLDSTSRSLDMLTGSEDRAIFDVGDIIDGTKPENTVIFPSDDLPALGFIPACGIKRLRDLSEKYECSPEDCIKKAVEAILSVENYDYYIVDTGGGIEFASSSASLFDMALIVSEQGKTSVRSAEYAAYQLKKNGANDMRLVICSFDLRSVKREKRAGIIEMIDSSSLACVGVVPFDRKLQKTQDSGRFPPEDSPTSIAYSNIASRLEGQEVHLFSGMGKLDRKRLKAL